MIWVYVDELLSSGQTLISRPSRGSHDAPVLLTKKLSSAANKTILREIREFARICKHKQVTIL